MSLDIEVNQLLRKKRHSTAEKFSNYRSRTIPAEANTFPFLFVDLTYRCNMKCNVCYNPVRPMPDMSLRYFEKAIKKLPHPIEVRMLGGEPTLRKDFYEFCKIAFDHGHSVYLSTNGKRLAVDRGCAKKLKTLYNQRKNLKAKLKIHIDMSGGLDPQFYEKIHNDKDALLSKLGALDSLKKENIGRTTISAILIRGLNESVIKDLFEIADRYPQVIREVAFRSQGNIGRYLSGYGKPYKTNEWLMLMRKMGFLNRDHFSKVIHSGFMDDRCEGRNCCYQYQYNRILTSSFLEFLNEGCWQRGQLLEEEYRIEYMFESLEANDINRIGYSDLGEEDINRMILKQSPDYA